MEDYVCICGKKFNSNRSLSAHKASCKEYYLQRDGNLENYYRRIVNHAKAAKDAGPKIGKIVATNSDERKRQKLQKWISEKHVCQHCGKVMTTYWGSGRFCSHSCANSKKHSNKTIKKISSTTQINNEKLLKYKTELYNSNPKCCIVCGNPLPYDKRFNNTCSSECKSKYISKKVKGKVGGYKYFSGSNKLNKGYYKGYYCDSTWELAYVIYNLEHNIEFYRCNRAYTYTYNNEIHRYHPDFELADGVLVEIKGYEYDDSLYYKISSVKDRPIKVLRYEDLKYALDYVVEKYGKDFRKLYEPRSNQDKHIIKELLLMGYWKTYEVDCDDGTSEDVIYEWVKEETEEE